MVSSELIGTLISAKIYEQIKVMKPNKEKALAYAKEFSYEDWSNCLKEFLGKSADEMIALEAKEHKYDEELHAKRLDVIIEKWDDVLAITFKATKDIRDKYVLSRLAWDLGVIEEIKY